MAETQKPIKRALVSVSDKTGLVNFCRSLVEDFGIEVISTGGRRWGGGYYYIKIALNYSILQKVPPTKYIPKLSCSDFFLLTRMLLMVLGTLTKQQRELYRTSKKLEIRLATAENDSFKVGGVSK